MQRKLALSPAQHGFHFRNDFINHVSPGITTYGLCGGMALAVARYWLNKVPIPTHVAADFPDGSPAGVPPEGSPLQSYIYGCQLASYGPLGLVSAANWVTMPWITLNDQFNWSVGEFANVKRSIDTGIPVVLGLRCVVGGPFGHQVLAYGYDDADSRVFVYDSNYPNEEHCLRLDLAARKIVYDGPTSPAWSSYFVTGCPMEGPRPDYVDLGLQAGIAVQASDPVPSGGRVAIDVTVHNFGFRNAHVQQLYIYVRGPRGENLDTLLGGGDHDPHPIPPGGERRIQRIAEVFGRAAGTYTIGASYLSDQQQWINLPPQAGGTRSEVTVRVVDAQRSPAAPWRSLGGVLNSAPAAGANADGRLEVFARGTDDRIWHLSQQRVDAPTEFSGWEMLAGDTTFTGMPAVTRNHWSKLELFARGRDRSLWHRWQNDPNVRASAQWSLWSSLGGQLDSDPTVATNNDGRLEVFAVGTDGRAYHIYQRWFDLFGAPWSGWEALGARRFTGRIAAERDGTGCLFAFARSRDDASVWWARQTTPSGPWTDWASTGGLGGEPALARNADGRLEVTLRGTDGKIWHQWQAAPGGAWSGWQLLHETSPTVPVLDVAARPTMWAQGDNSIAVIATESDREAYLIARTNQDPFWTNFQLVGSDVASEIAAASGAGASGLFSLGPARDLRVLLRRP
jgi:hypothetical protein